MIHLRLWRCVAIVALVPTLARGGTIYVNNAIGHDRLSGIAPEAQTETDGPVATITRALQLARGSDSIQIADTGIPYSESAIVDRPELAGSESYPFVINGHGALLRGARPVPATVWRYVGNGTYRYQAYRKGFYQLAVGGEPAEEVAVAPAATDPPPLEPLQWCAVHGFVYFRVEPGRYIDQYQIEAPLFDIGLGLHNARNVVVRDLRVELFRLDGVNVSGNSRNVRLVNIRSTANGRAGLAVTGTSRVAAAELNLAGNRVAERLVLLRGRIVDLSQSRLPPLRLLASGDAISMP